MVAMFGLIMPAPLAIPVTVTGTPCSSIRWEAILGRVSVVMMPSDASPQPCSSRAATAAGRPRSNGGKREQLANDTGGKRQYLLTITTSGGGQHITAGNDSFAMPRSPVPALA
jgi:hypothetical protein